MVTPRDLAATADLAGRLLAGVFPAAGVAIERGSLAGLVQDFLKYGFIFT